MTDAERYAISVRKVRVDDHDMWRASVRELPDLAEFADTRDEAIELVLDSIESLKAAALEESRPFPEPIEDEDEYSGRVTLRLPKSLHRAIAIRSLDEDVSLNSYICNVLATNTSGPVSTFNGGPIFASGFPQGAIDRASQKLDYWFIQNDSAGVRTCLDWIGGSYVTRGGTTINFAQMPKINPIFVFGDSTVQSSAPPTLTYKPEKRRQA